MKVSVNYADVSLLHKKTLVGGGGEGGEGGGGEGGEGGGGEGGEGGKRLGQGLGRLRRQRQKVPSSHALVRFDSQVRNTASSGV